MTPKHLEALIKGLKDTDPIDLTKHGFFPIGSRVRVMPGVTGQAIRHDEDGDTVVRCRVRQVRHTLRMAATSPSTKDHVWSVSARREVLKWR